MAIKFTKNDSGFVEDGAAWDATRDGERVGEIEAEKSNAGSILTPRWVTTAYLATTYGPSGQEREFIVADYKSASSALAAAKRWIRHAA